MDNLKYIVVEGPIGVGKTSLARKLAGRLAADLMLEQPMRLEILTSKRTNRQLLRCGKERKIQSIRADCSNGLTLSEANMNTQNNVIATQVAALPLTDADRREALYYVAAGETIAQAILSVAKWFEGSHIFKPSYR